MKRLTAEFLRGILALCLLIPASVQANPTPLDLTLPALDAEGTMFESARQVAAAPAAAAPATTLAAPPAGPTWSAGLSEEKALTLRWKMPW